MRSLNTTPEILFEDRHILVCVKPAGVPVQTRQLGAPDLEHILKNHLSRQASGSGVPYLAVIHRLDQPVRGILVFAKTPAAAKDLNRQLQSDGFSKRYRALLCGTPASPEGTLVDYLLKDGRTNTSRVCSPNTPGAKRAELSYKVLGPITTHGAHFNLPSLETNGTDTLLTEVEIQLKTGRHHQIRVQFAAAGTPLWGDAKYNPSFTRAARSSLALCACSLDFRHPATHKPLHFTIPNPWPL